MVYSEHDCTVITTDYADNCLFWKCVLSQILRSTSSTFQPATGFHLVLIWLCFLLAWLTLLPFLLKPIEKIEICILSNKVAKYFDSKYEMKQTIAFLDMLCTLAYMENLSASGTIMREPRYTEDLNYKLWHSLKCLMFVISTCFLKWSWFNTCKKWHCTIAFVYKWRRTTLWQYGPSCLCIFCSDNQYVFRTTKCGKAGFLQDSFESCLKFRSVLSCTLRHGQFHQCILEDPWRFIV